MDDVEGHKQVSAHVHRYVDTFTTALPEENPVLGSRNVTRKWSDSLSEELENHRIVPEWEEIVEEISHELMDDFLQPDPDKKTFSEATSYSPIDRTSYSLGLTGAYIADIMNLESTGMRESIVTGIEDSLTEAGLTHYRSPTGEIREISETLEYAEHGFEDYGSKISQDKMEEEIDRWSPVTDWKEYEQEITG